ncbi:MAG: glycosyltransferase [Magnetococcales bacterium]|nr:glycosyltransferase [Magnetococcales bacterium]
MRCLIIKLRRFDYYDDLRKACTDNGIHAVTEYCESVADSENILLAIDRFRPDFILNHPMFSIVVSRIGAAKSIPVLHWVVDKCLNNKYFQTDLYNKTDFIFLTYRDDAEKLAALGVKAKYLPNACNIEPVAPQVAEQPYGVSFVGTIEMGENNYYRRSAELARMKLNQESPDQTPLFEHMLAACDAILQQQNAASKEFRYILPELVARAYGQKGNILQVSGLQPDDLTLLLTKEAAFKQRRHFFQAIPHLEAFGPPDWQQAELPNVHYRGALPLRTSGKVFAASRINLSLTRIYALDGLSDRLFNVLAARGFLLANRQTTLSEIFQEGIDLETYATVEELLDKIRFYENHPLAREKIARHGQENVARNHTFTNRIREMLTLISG